MKLILSFILYSAVLASSVAFGQVAELKDPGLLRKNSSNIFVTMSQPLEPLFSQVSSQTFLTREAKIFAITQRLGQQTRRWHQPILDGLKRYNVKTKSFWSTNQIYVENANPRIISYLRGLPNVASIEEEEIFTLEQPSNNTVPTSGAPQQTIPWGVQRIRAPEVWPRTRGEGIVVAIIDTGVRGTHQALRNNFAGLHKNGWHDTSLIPRREPYDDNGHGTHVAGTAVGQTRGIGVAPGAQWIACKACNFLGICSQSNALECGEWSICPYNRQGDTANCQYAPHIVSCSWGIGRNNPAFNEFIDRMSLYGITPVFALGNSGPGCQTAGSPSDQVTNLIAVGASGLTDDIWDGSSRGPAPDGRIIPTLVAPGVSIYSAWRNADDGYNVIDGTSMAAPHVAGSVALLKSQSRNTLSFQRIWQLLTSTAVTNLQGNLRQCDRNLGQPLFPNSVAGYGRLDVAAASARLGL